ncbi:MAG: hypothetical protein ACOZAN_03060 [Patescibacteria group bacterium]
MVILRKLVHSLLILIGFLLSPLSWWNDLLVNVPLSYFLALPLKLVNEKLFFPAFVMSYWLTNIIGLLMMHFGIAGLNKNDCQISKKSLIQTFAFSCIYTLLIAILVKSHILESPVGTLQAFINH